MFTTLKPVDDRARSQQVVVDDLRGRLAAIPGIFAFPIEHPGPGPRATATRSRSSSRARTSTRSRATRTRSSRRGREVPGVVNLQTDLLINKPQLEVEIDRNRASDLGVLGARDRHAPCRSCSAGSTCRASSSGARPTT